MPRYDYKCNLCDEPDVLLYDENTNIEDIICKGCDSLGSLQRVFSFNIKKEKTEKFKVGSLVKEHIAKAKIELQKDREERRKGYKE